MMRITHVAGAAMLSNDASGRCVQTIDTGCGAACAAVRLLSGVPNGAVFALGEASDPAAAVGSVMPASPGHLQEGERPCDR